MSHEVRTPLNAIIGITVKWMWSAWMKRTVNGWPWCAAPRND